jgi:type I restriction enzyme M protein
MVVIEQKWMADISKDVEAELHRISQRLAQRIKELAERYETPLPALTNEVTALEEKVTAHLQKMGLAWK